MKPEINPKSKRIANGLSQDRAKKPGFFTEMRNKV